jgi:hypothetical protein
MNSHGSSYEVVYVVQEVPHVIEVLASDVQQAYKAAELKLALLHRSSDAEILKIARTDAPVSVDREHFPVSIESTDVESSLIQIARNMASTPQFISSTYGFPTQTFFLAALCLSDYGYDIPADVQEIFDHQREGSLPFHMKINIEDPERVPAPLPTTLNSLAWMIHGEWRTKHSSLNDMLSPDWDPHGTPRNRDEDADLEGNLFAYSYLLLVKAYKDVTDEPEEALIATYERIRQPFLDANGLSLPSVR